MKTFLLFCAVACCNLLHSQISGPLNASYFSNANLPGYNQQWKYNNNGPIDDNIKFFDNLTGGVGSHTDYLVATNFGFNFLPGTIFVGIKADVECWDSNSRTSDYSIRIVKKGSIGNDEKAKGTPYAPEDTYMTYGSSSDLWGETWDYKSINDNNFGVAIAAQRDINDGVTTNGRVLNVKITIYYTFNTLPVQLISFSATRNANTKSTTLQWTSASETNFDRYDIERSSDGRNFQWINSVAGRNQNNTNTYSIVDNNPPMGVSYYRLKMLESSGSEKYSKIVTIEFKSNEFILYPSVLAQGENIYVTNSNHIPLEISFFDMAGKKQASVTTDNNQLPVAQLPFQKGILIYKIYNAGKQETGSGRITIQ